MGDIFGEIQFSDRDLKEVLLNNPKSQWLFRAVNDPWNRTADNKTVYTFTVEEDGKHYVIPRVRLDQKSGELVEYGFEDAYKLASDNKDWVKASSAAEAEFISKGFSKYQDRKDQGGKP